MNADVCYSVFLYLIRLGLITFSLLLETMHHFTQKFWRGWSKNWGEGLEPLSLIASEKFFFLSFVCFCVSANRQQPLRQCVDVVDRSQVSLGVRNQRCVTLSGCRAVTHFVFCLTPFLSTSAVKSNFETL